jgi:hypothetical protein
LVLPSVSVPHDVSLEDAHDWLHQLPAQVEPAWVHWALVLHASPS